MKQFNLWFSIVIITSSLLLLLCGYIIGHYLMDENYGQNTISVGIKEMNKLNNDMFVCSCTSNKGLTIKFNESGVYKDKINYSNYTPYNYSGLFN